MREVIQNSRITNFIAASPFRFLEFLPVGKIRLQVFKRASALYSVLFTHAFLPREDNFRIMAFHSHIFFTFLYNLFIFPPRNKLLVCRIPYRPLLRKRRQYTTRD